MKKELSAIEQQRLNVQAELDSQRDALERNKLGQFATPTALADAITRAALVLLGKEAKPLNFFEPSIGSGSFFSALLKNLGKRKLGSATGIEIDERFAKAARNFWATSGLKVINNDFANVVPPTKPENLADLLLANPPYVRHHYLEKTSKAKLNERSRKIIDSSVSGLSGLYVYFLLLCHDWLRDGGIAAWLIPNEWMSVNYGSAVRLYLTSKVQLLRVHTFDAEDVKFDDALVSSSVVFYRKNSEQESETCLFTSGSDIMAPSVTKQIKIENLKASGKWQLFFKDTATSSSEQGDVALGDLFEIRRGVATGSNDFFIKPKEFFEGLGIPKKFLTPVLPPSRKLVSNMIGGDASGFPLTDPQLALLDCALPEPLVKMSCPALWRYLNSSEAAEAKAGYLSTQREPWYRQEKRRAPEIVLTYMGRESEKSTSPFKFFLNQSQAICTNSYLLMSLKVGADQKVGGDGAWLKKLVSYLNGIETAEFLRYGRVYGGGLFKLEPKELGRMTLPKSLVGSRGKSGIESRQVAMSI